MQCSPCSYLPFHVCRSGGRRAPRIPSCIPSSVSVHLLPPFLPLFPSLSPSLSNSCNHFKGSALGFDFLYCLYFISLVSSYIIVFFLLVSFDALFLASWVTKFRLFFFNPSFVICVLSYKFLSQCSMYFDMMCVQLSAVVS